MPVSKGQKLQTYSFELKKKAIEMRLMGMTKKKVEEELGITDIVPIFIIIIVLNEN